MKGPRGVAYTLVELLVVIGIMLVLAGLFFSVFVHVKEKVRQSACISNQRLLWAAMMMTVQDNKEVFPGTVNSLEPTEWIAEMQGNASSTKIFHCPAATGMKANKLVTSQSDYGFNPYLYGAALGDVKKPEEAVDFADGAYTLLRAGADVAMTRHANGYIANFVDGHCVRFPASNSPVIYGNGDEGTLLSFCAVNVPVIYTANGAATTEVNGVHPGGEVLLENASDADITAQVSVAQPAGADTPPQQGLLPATANLTIHAGKSKGFALYPFTNSAINWGVDTTYTFGSGASSVTITVFVPPLLPPSQ